jgi:outer membrane protein assembly factor BamA
MINMKPKSLNYTSYVSLLLLLGLLLFSNNIFCQKKYVLQYNLSGKDTLYKLQQLDLKLNFDTKQAAQLYLNQLPAMLLSKGFPAASVDSVFYDSTSAKAILFLGEQYKWAQINTDSIEQDALASVGWNEKQFDNKKMDFNRLEVQQERILNYYENSGYPFAEVSLENIDISADKIKGDLRIKKGILYHIDSIKIIGTVKIKNSFLQHYLGIFNGSVYNNQKIKEISTRISELPFLQETQRSNITMLGSGATLNVYLQPKRSSEINVLVGFLPGNAISTKSQLTADVHLNLNNALGSGENILLNWQQLQPQSPRLNLGYTHPYIFNSNFGINFSFDLLKRDSAYLQLNSILAIQYAISPRQSFKVFYQNENSFLLSGGVDTNQVLYSKRLPPNIDVSSGNMGIGYHFVKTDYRLNPRKGSELDVTASAGIKKTSKNNDIINLKDPANPAFDFNSLYDSVKLKTYRFRIVGLANHYFPLGKQNTLKTAVDFGLLQSPQNFMNELFRIGGNKILRGFDEESIFANQYAVFTAEYRYLVGINSYFFGFSDVGFTKTKYNNTEFSNSFISGGVGLAFETKFGLLNLSYALGKRNDVKFDLRNSSKIHFGYINYF